jgi:SOS-response transcriptional repressor LexA
MQKKQSVKKKKERTPGSELPLTDRQREFLATIEALTAENKRPPTVREIGAALGIKSPNGVTGHLRLLEKKGYIERSRKSRSIKLLRSNTCPCCGRPFP